MQANPTINPNTFAVYRDDLNSSQVKEYYNTWTEYDQHLNPQIYTGPVNVARAVKRMFPNQPDTQIADVGAGTGQVGNELRGEGFRNLVAIEAATKCIEKANGIYQNVIPCYIGSESKEMIAKDEFPCVVSSGVFGANHMPLAGINELIRIVKPGGIIVTCMREEYLDDYDGKLEPYLEELAKLGYIERLERQILDNYYSNKTGLLLVHKVLVSGFSDFKSTVLVD